MQCFEIAASPSPSWPLSLFDPEQPVKACVTQRLPPDHMAQFCLACNHMMQQTAHLPYHILDKSIPLSLVILHSIMIALAGCVQTICITMLDVVGVILWGNDMQDDVSLIWAAVHICHLVCNFLSYLASIQSQQHYHSPYCQPPPH